jgi:hypothetical protein
MMLGCVHSLHHATHVHLVIAGRNLEQVASGSPSLILVSSQVESGETLLMGGSAVSDRPTRLRPGLPCW